MRNSWPSSPSLAIVIDTFMVGFYPIGRNHLIVYSLSTVLARQRAPARSCVRAGGRQITHWVNGSLLLLRVRVKIICHETSQSTNAKLRQTPH